MADNKERYLLSTAAGRGEGVIEIGGLEFDSRAFTLREADAVSVRGSEKEILETLTGPLKARLLTAGREDEVSTDFLMDHLTHATLTALLKLLINGSYEPDPKR